MTGADAQHGFFYQNYVGVFRVLESFLSDEKPEYIRFESEKETLEDINIYFSNFVIYEQVKIQQHSLWQPSELKKILSSFARKYKELQNLNKKIIFRFTTNTYYSKSVRNFVDLQMKINKQGVDSIDDFSELDRYFTQNTDKDLRIEIIKNMQLNWNFCSFINHISPEYKIKEECMSLLFKYDNLDFEEKNRIILSLFDYICKCASVPRKLTDFTLNDFNRITRLEIVDHIQMMKLENFAGKDLLSFLLSRKPQILRYRDVFENNVITYIYFQEINFKAVIGILDDYKTENEIEELCEYIGKLVNTESYLILKGNKVNRLHLPIAFRDKVYSIEEFKDEFAKKVIRYEE